MSDPRAVVDALVSAVLARDANRAAALYAEDVVLTDPVFEDVVGREAAREAFEAFFSAWEIHDLEIVDTLVEGDRIVVRWSWTALHTGEYLGVPATGKEFSTWNVIIFDMANGLVTGDLSLWDASQLRRLEELADS